MKPLSEMPREEARDVRGLLFDLDDTLLSHGVLTRAAYDALWSLRDAGLRLVAVTGRPSAWGEVLVRQWPIDGAVTENGAITIVREGSSLARLDSCSTEERRGRRIRLAALIEEVRGVVPEARLTDDIDGRLSDVTWDIGERMTLRGDRVDAILATLRAGGFRAFRSSVHLHATLDDADKASGVLAFLARLGESMDDATERFAFIGDSGNDAACFEAFRTTVGVANVAPHVSHLPQPPRYVTPSAMGMGFAELARALLDARR